MSRTTGRLTQEPAGLGRERRTWKADGQKNRQSNPGTGRLGRRRPTNHGHEQKNRQPNPRTGRLWQRTPSIEARWVEKPADQPKNQQAWAKRAPNPREMNTGTSYSIVQDSTSRVGCRSILQHSVGIYNIVWSGSVWSGMVNYSML